MELLFKKEPHKNSLLIILSWPKPVISSFLSRAFFAQLPWCGIPIGQLSLTKLQTDQDIEFLQCRLVLCSHFTLQHVC